MDFYNVQKKNILIKPLTIILFVGIVLLSIGGITVTRINSNDDDFQEIESGWVDADGNEVSLDSFASGKIESSVYYTYEGIERNISIIFAVRNAYVDVYQDGRLLESDTKIDSKIFGVSPGTKWHFVSLDACDGSTTIELKCTLSYPNSHVYISNCYLGNSSTLYRLVAAELMPDFFMNVIWIIFTIVMVIIYIAFRKYFRFSRDLLFLSLGAFFCATWCGVETRMFQYFFGHSEFFHLIGYLSMLMIPIPYGLLAIERCKDEPKWRKWALIYTLTCEIVAVILCALHLTGILEFHYSLKVVHAEIAFLFPFMTRIMIDYSKEQSVAQLKKILRLGYIILVVFLFIGMVRYLTGHYSDYSIFIKVALFALIIILLVYQMAGINEVFVKGLQAEFVKDMAMLDHLTKFYNRTGYADHLTEYEESDRPLGVVQFDINNLKIVNDRQGHEKGDELICLASSGISESFSQAGRCYRMGGDEFLVVLTGENPKADFENGIKNFLVYCDNVNSMQNRTFDLEVAYGFTIKYVGQSMSSALEEADGLMYENKRQMKNK